MPKFKTMKFKTIPVKLKTNGREMVINESDFDDQKHEKVRRRLALDDEATEQTEPAESEDVESEESDDSDDVISQYE